MSLVGVLPQVSLVQNAHLGGEVGENGVGAGGDVNAVVHRQLDGVALAAQGAAGQNFNFDTAIGGFLDQLSDLQTALNEGSRLRVNKVHLELDDFPRSLGRSGSRAVGSGSCGFGLAAAGKCQGGQECDCKKLYASSFMKIVLAP